MPGADARTVFFLPPVCARIDVQFTQRASHKHPPMWLLFAEPCGAGGFPSRLQRPWCAAAEALVRLRCSASVVQNLSFEVAGPQCRLEERQPYTVAAICKSCASKPSWRYHRAALRIVVYPQRTPTGWRLAHGRSTESWVITYLNGCAFAAFRHSSGHCIKGEGSLQAQNMQARHKHN